MAYKPLSPRAQAGAEDTVVSYLKRTNAPTNLLIRFNESGLKCNEISSLLREQKDRRITYDRLTGRLKVYSMAPSPLHQAVLNFVVRTLHRALRDGIFTHHESDRVSSSNDSVTIKTTSNVPEGTKPLAFSKYADANIVFGLPPEPQIPSVVFEVGLSENRDDLQIDASQWLMHTGNLTHLVVVIDVKEDRKALASALKSAETKERRRALLKQYGNDKALNDNDFSGEEDDDYNSAQVPAGQEMVYAAIADDIFLDDWVGPVSATIELWERGENGPRLRDGLIVSSFYLCLIVSMLIFDFC